MVKEYLAAVKKTGPDHGSNIRQDLSSWISEWLDTNLIDEMDKTDDKFLIKCKSGEIGKKSHEYTYDEFARLIKELGKLL